jgi:vancomycin permeability regulator SanA
MQILKYIKAIQAILLASIVTFLFFVLVITIDGFHDQIKKSDVAIIFGSKVYPNGNVSPRLAARLDKAVELYKQGFFSSMIVSGGTGKEGVDEAIAMKRYLIAQHIPEVAILVDSHGTNTMETAKNSVMIMHAHGFKNALIVSQYFHIKRARLALQQCGLSTIYNAHPNFFEWRDIYSLVREVVGYCAYSLHPNNQASY